MTPAGAARLHPIQDAPVPWPADLLAALLRSVPVVDVFAESTRLASFSRIAQRILEPYHRHG